MEPNPLMQQASKTHCRFCAEEKTNVEFINWSEDSNLYKEYVKIFRSLNIDYIDLNDSTLPTISCEECYNSFSTVCMFLQSVKKAQITLKNLYKANDIKIEPFNVTIKSEDIDTLGYSESQRKHDGTDINQLNTTVKEIKEECSNYSDSVDTPDVGTSSIIIDKKNMKRKNVPNFGSWDDYTWTCIYCNEKFGNITELRTHSKETHNKCYAFKCMDCCEQFNIFNLFVEHVRRHKNFLRNYCQHCNQKFDDRKECEDHVLTHWSESHRICLWCGEICPDVESLKLHEKMYDVMTLPPRFRTQKPKVVVPDGEYNGVSGWEDYDWTCLDCGVRQADLDALRAHAQNFHKKCFVMKCMDCLSVQRNYISFLRHVRDHRPYLEKFCHRCNVRFDNIVDLHKHGAKHILNNERHCGGCGQVFYKQEDLLHHTKIFDSLIGLHYGPKKENVTCAVCGKCFQYSSLLSRHLKIHEKDRVPAKKAAEKKSNVANSSSEKDCQENVSCNKLKISANKNKDKTVICNHCGEKFNNKISLISHIAKHEKPERRQLCVVCGKTFKTKANLKTHMNIHSESRPFPCKHCEKGFNSWSNCNKHMKRKHGDSLVGEKAGWFSSEQLEMFNSW